MWSKKTLAVLIVGLLPIVVAAQHPPVSWDENIKREPAIKSEAIMTVEGQEGSNGYVLGPGDQISIHALNAEEISDKPIPIGPDGYFRIPIAGRVPASGLTTMQVESEIATRLRKYIKNPDVSVAVAEFRSQPVSVLGAVKSPGVQQVREGKNLFEMLSLAGGLEPNAGSMLRITRRLEWGALPLPGARDDPTGTFSVAEVSLKSIFEAKDPNLNIFVKPYDVISVPKADTVYVIGQVQKPGGILLTDHDDVTVLQALSLSGGLDKSAKPQDARILRRNGSGSSTSRLEIAVNVSKLLEGKTPDVPMQPEDILFIPSSISKKAGVRALEAAVQTATGLAIWRIP